MTTWKTWNAGGGACETCTLLDGVTIEEDDNFDAGWGEIDGPDENHPGCECELTLYEVDDGYAATLANQIMG